MFPLGRALHARMQEQVEGLTDLEHPDPNYTLDQVTTMNDIKRRVDALEEQMEYSLRMLQQQQKQDRGRKYSDILPPAQTLQLPDLEAAMKTVG